MAFFQRSNKLIKLIDHPAAHQLYNYHLGDIYTPGAMAEVFFPLTNNPLYSHRGAGRTAGQFFWRQPQPLTAQATTMMAGIPPQAGQFVSQRLQGKNKTGS